MVPRGATVIENRNGSAPGLWLERGGTALLVLPGPPREMMPMLEAIIEERLASRSGGAGLFRRVLRITGRTESDVDARAAADLLAMVDDAGADRDDDSRRLGTDRTAPHRVGQRSTRCRCRAAGGGRRAAGGARLRHLLGGWTAARSRRRRSAAPGRVDDCGCRVVHRRPVDVAPDRRPRQLRLRRPRAWSATAIARRSSCWKFRPPSSRSTARSASRSRGRWPTASAEWPQATWASASRALPVPAAALRRSRSEPSQSPSPPTTLSACERSSFFGGREMVKFQSAQAAMNMLRLMMTS